MVKGPDKECKYVILGEKAKAQLVRDSKKDIQLSISELQKNPLNYSQVVFVQTSDLIMLRSYSSTQKLLNDF